MNKIKKELIEQIHQFRKEIDVNILKAKNMKAQLKYSADSPTTDTLNSLAQREMLIVYTKLQEAKMWAGKCLEVLGSENQDKAEETK